MNAPDLRTQPPRRWSDAIDGVIWLPRIAEKARAFDAGTLGSFLYGQSPIDDSFLGDAKLDYDSFLEIVRSASGDAEVLREIERRNPGTTARLQAWSAAFPKRRAVYIRLWDLDEGYVNPWWATPARALGNLAFVPVLALLRKLRPRPRAQ